MRWDGTEVPPLMVFALSGRVGAVDRATGELRWTNELEGGGLQAVYLAVERDVVLASATGARLFCLDYATGKTIWSAATTKMGRASILVDGQQIFVAKGGVINCFDRQGALLWTNALKGFGVGGIALGLPGNVAQADAVGG